MPHRPLILINLPIIPTLIRFIAKKVDSLILNAIRQILIRLDMAQTVRLVPAVGEDIEGDLAADGETARFCPARGATRQLSFGLSCA